MQFPVLESLAQIATQASQGVNQFLASIPVPDQVRLLLDDPRAPSPWAAAAVAAIAVAALRSYRKHFVPPAHLRHLPRQTMLSIVRTMLARRGFLPTQALLMERIRADAIRRGVIKDETETPRLWCTWLFGRWAVVVANPEDARQVLTNHETFEKFDFAKLGLKINGDLLGKNVAMTPTHDWKRQRKVVNPAFRRGFATSLFATPTRQLLVHMDAHCANGKPVDIAVWMQRMTLDALSSVGFGVNFDSINHPDAPMVKLYNEVMSALVDPSAALLGPLAALSPRIRRSKQAVREFNQFIFSLVDDKTASLERKRSSGAAIGDEDDEPPADLLELMVSASSNGSFSREDLRANTVVFFIAGHDTTANALTFAMYLLGRHPEIQAKARREVLSVMGDVSKGTSIDDMPYPTNEQQQLSMPYLTMVIKETMRLYPSVTAMPTRELTKPVKLYNGLELPKDSLVVVNDFVVQRAKEYWGKDAAEFRPERWEGLGVAVAGGEEAGGSIPLHPTAHNFTWMPFGGGQRICMGQQFSITEQRVLLSMMLARYEWSVVGNDEALAGMPETSPGGLLHPLNIMLNMKSLV
ncbi:cytochrome P450 [Blastocladiella britannica]|nr:cytochrome P450 [Blastocladiella britannica]